MDFVEKHLKETLEAIKTLNKKMITVKGIRIARNVKSSDRSKINFIWRALKSLTNIGFLELNGSKNPKKYKLKDPETEIDTEKVISHVLRKRFEKAERKL